MTRSHTEIDSATDQTDGNTTASMRMLVVGNEDMGEITAGQTIDLENFLSVRFEDISSDLIGSFNPEIVLSKLFGPGFDALDLARRLVASGFAGQYRVLAIGISDPALISREISFEVPGIDFDVFEIDAD